MKEEYKNYNKKYQKLNNRNKENQFNKKSDFYLQGSLILFICSYFIIINSKFKNSLLYKNITFFHIF
jgi:uncharacterized membrane protein